METQKMNKKGKMGLLTTIFVLILIGTLVFSSMWLFYADIVDNYGDGKAVNHSKDSDFYNISGYMIDTRERAENDSEEMHTKYLNSTGTEATGEDSMILNSFTIVKKVMRSSFNLVFNLGSEVQTRLGIHPMWIGGGIAILLFIVIIVIISGFLRTTNW